MIVPESIQVDLRDPEIALKVEGRVTLLLDTNVWIDVAEAKTVRAVRLQDRLRELVKSAKLFCPLTFTTIEEVLHQAHNSAAKVAVLMEDLSLNVAFAPSEELFIKEVDAAFDMIGTGCLPRLNAVDIFVPVMSFLSTQGTLRFPATFPPERRQRLIDDLARDLRKIGFVEFIDKLKTSMPMPRRAAPPYQAAALRRREAAGSNRGVAWKIEAETVLRRILLPRLRALLRTLPDELLARWRELPPAREAALANLLLPHMPATRHYIDVMAAAGLDTNRDYELNDFFDLELIKAPLVYSDVFMTRDKWIRHLLTREIKTAAVVGKRYLWHEDDLETYLAGLG